MIDVAVTGQKPASVGDVAILEDQIVDIIDPRELAMVTGEVNVPENATVSPPVGAELVG